MERLISAWLGVLVLAFSAASPAADTWTEGKHYALIAPVQRTSVPAGKVEVMEVFSYGCIACNRFQPVIEKVRANLPSNAQMVFMHAAFNTAESWPIFQRAYYAAEALGIAERTHQGIYDAVWKTGELAVSDQKTHQLKNPQPTLENVAQTYSRLAGIKPDAFLAAAKSFGVDAKMRAADAQVKAMRVPGTPCIVVNGKYRVNTESLANVDELNQLVAYLVAKESGG